MYTIPEDDFDTGIRHAMLHVDFGRVYHIAKGKTKLSLPDEDRQKIIRKYTLYSVICVRCMRFVGML